MQLRFTKGVGVALAIAAGCAVLGFVMAPGWWAFAAFSAWWALTSSARGVGQNNFALLLNDANDSSVLDDADDLDLDPAMRGLASNVYTNWDFVR